MTRRDRIALGVVVAIAALAAYWFLLMSPKREEASAVKGKVAQQETRLQTARSNLAESQAAKSSYAANYTAVARLGKAVPADDDIGSLVYQLDKTANATGSDFRTIKLLTTGSGLVTPPAPAASAGGQQPKSGSAAKSTPASGTPAAPAAPSQAATAALPPGASVGPAGLATMPFTFKFEGSFSRLSDFFGRVQRYISTRPGTLAVSGRLVTLNGLAVTFSDRGYPHMKASVAATAYLLPASEGLLDGATPATPPQTGAKPVSGPSSTSPTAPATITGP